MVETTFSANNREEVFVLPFTPVGISFAEPQNNSDFEGLSRGRAVIGVMQPIEISFTSRFFKNRLSWFHPLAIHKPMQYVEFFRKWREKLVPIRFTIVSDDSVICNMAVLVDSFEWEMLKNGDIVYSISLREYKFIK